jgi:DNA repair photolyase
MSFLTDCYTPAEAKYQLTRQCLKLILEAGHKVRVQTRSVLVERDFDLLLAHSDRVLLGTSIPHLDDRLARVLEPRAAAPSRRLLMLQRAAEGGIPIYVAIAPFLPFHGREELEEVLARLSVLGTREIFCEVLNPKGDNIAMMMEALQPSFPDYARRLAGYSARYWAEFTWNVLSHGFTHSQQFIPWPDTRRQWRAFLPEESVDFLEKFLPDASLAPA